MSEPLRPTPDPESAPFWAATRRHVLTVQRCDGCGTWRFPPRPVCPRCGSVAATWTPTTGLGTLISWTVIHHVTHPAFAAQVPYPVLLVQLDEQDDVVMYGNLRPADAQLRPGMRLRASFEDVDDELTLVQWTPAADDGPPDQ